MAPEQSAANAETAVTAFSTHSIDSTELGCRNHHRSLSSARTNWRGRLAEQKQPLQHRRDSLIPRAHENYVQALLISQKSGSSPGRTPHSTVRACAPDHA
jgi:hypothetical protein